MTNDINPYGEKRGPTVASLTNVVLGLLNAASRARDDRGSYTLEIVIGAGILAGVAIGAAEYVGDTVVSSWLNKIPL